MNTEKRGENSFFLGALRVRGSLRVGVSRVSLVSRAECGGGGVASESQSRLDRRERLRQLALQTVDLAKDPYFMKNHLGSYECKLCLTVHNNEGNYMAHTQGKRHQQNLARRALKEQRDNPMLPQVNRPPGR